MTVTNYYTIDGSIIGEATGGVRTDYLTDALGSVTATVDSSGNLQNTYRYKPYGEQLAKTGTAADPKFTWVGSLGYRQTGRKHSDTYVRARHYGSTVGRWTTKDPIGFDGRDWNLYRYVANNPIHGVDPSGLQTQHRCEGSSNLCINFHYDYPDIPCTCAGNVGWSQKTHFSVWLSCCTDPREKLCWQYVADDIYCCLSNSSWEVTFHLLHFIDIFEGSCNKVTGRCKGANAQIDNKINTKIRNHIKNHQGWKTEGTCPEKKRSQGSI